jgi:hypothetical protein
MQDQSQQYRQIIAKCWTDRGFEQQLLADPAGALAAEGISVPDGVTVKVVQDTEQVVHLVIPARPQEVSDDALKALAGGILEETEFYACNVKSPTPRGG